MSGNCFTLCFFVACSLIEGRERDNDRMLTAFRFHMMFAYVAVSCGRMYAVHCCEC